MKKYIAASILVILFSTSLLAAEEPVIVRHTAPITAIPKKGYFPNMWFYRTEIINNTRRPLKVVWFDGFFKNNGKWYAANILGHTMRKKEFGEWYTEGSKIIDGIIPPGKMAVCDVNWHGGRSKEYIDTKWSYILVDDRGNDFFVEKIVDPKVVKYVHYGSNQRAHPAP